MAQTLERIRFNQTDMQEFGSEYGITEDQITFDQKTTENGKYDSAEVPDFSAETTLGAEQPQVAYGRKTTEQMKWGSWIPVEERPNTDVDIIALFNGFPYVPVSRKQQRFNQNLRILDEARTKAQDSLSSKNTRTKTAPVETVVYQAEAPWSNSYTKKGIQKGTGRYSNRPS